MEVLIKLLKAHYAVASSIIPHASSGLLAICIFILAGGGKGGKGGRRNNGNMVLAKWIFYIALLISVFILFYL